MFTLTVGSNIDRQKVPCELTSTPRQALEDNEIDYTVGTIHLDGCTLSRSDLDVPFADLGITTKASLIVVTKADAA